MKHKIISLWTPTAELVFVQLVHSLGGRKQNEIYNLTSYYIMAAKCLSQYLYQFEGNFSKYCYTLKKQVLLLV